MGKKSETTSDDEGNAGVGRRVSSLVTAEWLRAVELRMKVRGWNKAELARRVGASRTAITDLFTKRKSILVPDIERALDLSFALVMADDGRQLARTSYASWEEWKPAIEHAKEWGKPLWGPFRPGTDESEWFPIALDVAQTRAIYKNPELADDPEKATHVALRMLSDNERLEHNPFHAAAELLSKMAQLSEQNLGRILERVDALLDDQERETMSGGTLSKEDAKG